MKKLLCILALVVGVLIAISLSIWLGFPSPNFNRLPICCTGYAICLALIFVGVDFIFEVWSDDD